MDGWILLASIYVRRLAQRTYSHRRVLCGTDCANPVAALLARQDVHTYTYVCMCVLSGPAGQHMYVLPRERWHRCGRCCLWRPGAAAWPWRCACTLRGAVAALCCALHMVCPPVCTLCCHSLPRSTLGAFVLTRPCDVQVVKLRNCSTDNTCLCPVPG